MDEAAASKILEDYLTGQASPAEFERALEFLKSSATLNPALAALYRDLDLPGGLNHETAQELMPYYLEPLARAQLPQEERSRLVAHLAQCPACASDFLALQDFSAVPAPQPQVKKESIRLTDQLLKPWPVLEGIVQTFKSLHPKIQFSINFSLLSASAVRETGAVYRAGEVEAEGFADYKVLFEDTLAEDDIFLEAVVTAWRTSPTQCDLQVELSDPAGTGQQTGQTVIVAYEGKQLSQKTNETGETVFLGLEIEKIPNLKIEIQLN